MWAQAVCSQKNFSLTKHKKLALLIGDTAVLADGESQQLAPVPASLAPDNEPTAGNTTLP